MGEGLQRPASVMKTLQRVLISVSGASRYRALGPDLFLLTGDAEEGIAGFKFSWLWRPRQVEGTRRQQTQVQ